jgi:histidine ammonia-lyase
MGMTAARHARDVIADAEIVVALEALAAAQGLELRAPLRPAEGTAVALAAIREAVPFLDGDRPLKPDIDAVIELVQSGGFVDAVEKAIGSLE